jgi:magnesium transporter
MRGMESAAGEGSSSVGLLGIHTSAPTSSSRNVFIGLFLSVLASFMNSTGLNLQRYAKTRERPMINIVGIILSTVCGLVDMCSFHFAPQSLLAPIGAMTLVFNLLSAPLLHGESLQMIDYLSTFFVFSGTVTCLYFGSRHKQEYTPAEIYGLASQHVFQVYMVFVVITVLSLMLYVRNSEVLGRGALRRVGVGYPACAGILGGVTVLTVRTLGELMKSSSYNLVLVVFLVILVALVATTQVAILNRGLGRHSSLLIIPVFTGTFITSNIVGGGILYNEFSNATGTEQNAYFFGLAMVIGGIGLLTLKEGKLKSLTKVVEAD